MTQKGLPDEIPGELAATPGAELNVRIEIPPTTAGRLRRRQGISENARTLRFDQAGFEDG